MNNSNNPVWLLKLASIDTTVTIFSDISSIFSSQNKEQKMEPLSRLRCAANLTVETDSAPSVVSMGVQTSSPLIHLGIVVTVERVAVTVACWEKHQTPSRPGMTTKMADAGSLPASWQQTGSGCLTVHPKERRNFISDFRTFTKTS